jgi:hypothetical protein
MSLLNWSTYQSLPPLRSYAAALKHFETVQPIRGDADGTKPVGRRDQKWLSIYKRETDNAVCVGSTWHRGQQKALLAYYPDGRVAIEQRIGASCRERIQRIAGLNIERRNNEDWVTAAAHVDGEEVVGHYTLNLKYNDPRKVFFILRENATALYLNPLPVFKHVLNRKAKAEIMPRFKPFLSYVEAMAKLSAPEPDNNPWSKESRDNPRLPSGTMDERTALGLPQHGSLRWSPDKVPEFISLIESDDTESWYKAMLWLTVGSWRKLLNEARLDVMHHVHQQYRDVLFTKVRVDAGNYVRDRYGLYFT